MITHKLIPTEYQEQKSLIEWAQYQPYESRKISDYLIHVANGGYRNKREAKRLKEIGVKAGVSDLFLAIPSKGLHGLWIEMKRRSNMEPRPTAKQRAWIDLMRSNGYRAEVCRGWVEAARVIMEYLG